jgi:RNA polymerase sporulation-specific sigma factor
VLTDEKLVARARTGDTVAMEVIVVRYEPVARWVAADFYDPSGDPDDLRQEARIGIVKAVRDYQPGATAFRHFAFLCCRRQVVTAVMTATRGKHEALTHAVRVSVIDDGERVDAVDQVEAVNAEPAEILAERDQLRTLVAAIRDDLSPLEREWIIAHVFCGERYSGRGTAKVADNALQRARRKMLRALKDAA